MSSTKDTSRYRKVEVQMWARGSFTRLSPVQPSGQALWLYLLTNPDTTAIPGLFRAGEAGMAEALGWSLKSFRRCWKEVEAEGMARADWRHRVVWLPSAIDRNAPTAPNQVKGWRRHWEEIPDCQLKHDAWESLRSHLDGCKAAFAAAFAEACPEPQVAAKGKASRKPSRKAYPKASGKPSGKACPPGGGKASGNQESGVRSQDSGESPPPSPPPPASATPPSSGPPGGTPPATSGAAASSRAPGADRDRDRGTPLEQAFALLRQAAPNLTGQQRNGRDVTLRRGSYYLLRIGTIDVALRDRLERDWGREPAPGALLEAAAPRLFSSCAERLAKRIPSIRKPAAYVRTALAERWQEFLGRLADEVAKRRAGMRAAGGEA